VVRRGRSNRGAVAVVAVTVMFLILICSVLLSIRVAAVVTANRAQIAADAAAHAAAGFLAANPVSDVLSFEVQQNQTACLIDAGQPGTGAENDSTGLCAAAQSRAQAAAAANQVAAQLTSFEVAPDTRKYTTNGGPVALVVILQVQVHGPLSDTVLCAGNQSALGLCQIAAWSAAQESG